MSGRLCDVLLVAFLLALLPPTAAHATFHLAVVNEVMSGKGGNPNVQFVEIKMLSSFQNLVAKTRLTAFNCNFTACKVLMVVPFSIPNGVAGLTWLMASPNDATFSVAFPGVHADFYWDTASFGSIDPRCGMICWGAPGLVTPDPANWNPGDPDQYVDCVAYGPYTGRTKTSIHDGTPKSGTPTSLTPGTGTQSLTRVTNTGNNAADFILASPTPAANGAAPRQATTGPEPCTPVTVCGDGHTNPPEQCDPPGSLTCPGSAAGAFLPCKADCSCPALPTTTTTTSTSTTTTSRSTTTSTRPPTTTTSSSTTTTIQTTTTTTTRPTTTTSSTTSSTTTTATSITSTSATTSTTTSTTTTRPTTSTTSSTTTMTSSTTTTSTSSTSTTITQPTTTTSATSSTTTTTSVTSTTVISPNAPPDCRAAVADPAELWPPNHRFVGVSVVGVTDPDGDPVTTTITGIRQDEPLGVTCPDGTGVGTASANLRVERLGSGDGRVYEVNFTAADGRGGQCSGTVTVCVPHDQRPGHACRDQGPLFDSTGPCSSACGDVCTAIEPALAAPLCPGERVPAALKLRADHARYVLRRAAAARSERKVRTLVARMLKDLRTSAALAGAAEENGSISRACGAALGQLFSEAQGRAARWSRTR